MKIKDKVKSRLSLWSGDIGEISGIVHQQSFNGKDLIVVESNDFLMNLYGY